MAIPNTRETLKQYCLRNLGKPVIDINVDDDQVEDRLDEALQYFSQYHTDGVERMYLKYKVTADDVTRLTTNKSYNVDEKCTAAANIELEDGTLTSGDTSGELVYGESTTLDIIAQTSNLTNGEYSGEIIISSNSQSAVVVPVSLLVLDDGLLGDVNGDGVLNVLDVVTLVNIILNNDDYILAGDMNQDGALDVLDIVTLVNIILS